MLTINLGATRATDIGRRPAFVRSLFFAGFLFAFNLAQAQDYGLYWKYKDYDGAVAVSVPGWVTQIGSLFIDGKENRQVIRKIRKMRVLVFQEGISPFKTKDFERFNRKAKRRHLDELVTVRDGKTRVQIYGKMRRNTIRKVVVFFNSPDDGAGLVTVKGKFNIGDINKAIKKAQKESKKGDKEVVPELVKIPVKQV
jgi:Domain of unknown function (DUF4252)